MLPNTAVSVQSPVGDGIDPDTRQRVLAKAASARPPPRLVGQAETTGRRSSTRGVTAGADGTARAPLRCAGAGHRAARRAPGASAAAMVTPTRTTSLPSTTGARCGPATAARRTLIRRLRRRPLSTQARSRSARRRSRAVTTTGRIPAWAGAAGRGHPLARSAGTAPQRSDSLRRWGRVTGRRGL